MITIHTRTSRRFVFPLAGSECREIAAGLLESLELRSGDLEICFVDDVEMSALHEQHLRGIGPTNVLAFPEESEADELPDVFDEMNGGEGYAEAYDFDSDALEEDAADFEGENFYEETDEGDGPEVFLPEMLHEGFTAEADATGGTVAGSIVFSVDALHRECVLYDQFPHVYFARLLAHALLHLTGVPHGAFMEERMEYAVAQVLAVRTG